MEVVSVRPGNALEGASVESACSRFRDECLSTHCLDTRADAHPQIAR